MGFLKAARCTLIGSISLMAVACTQTTVQEGASGSDDNGANCGGTPINKESCVNNQNRMNANAGSVPSVHR